MSRIFIIEDNSLLQKKIKSLLSRYHFEVMEHLDSERLTRGFLSVLMADLDMIMLDFNGRFYDPYLMLERIRSVSHSMPIIGMGYDVDVAQVVKAIKAGCNDFVLKPFSEEDLVFKARKHLSGDYNKVDEPVQDSLENDVEDTRLSWEDTFTIGVETIDEEHRAIINQYDILYQRMRLGKGHEYFKELLLFLNEYVETHFDHEEIMHREHHYPLADQHHRIHEGFKRKIQELYVMGQGNSPSNQDLIQLNLFIKNWVITHILVEDKKFGGFLASR